MLHLGGHNLKVVLGFQHFVIQNIKIPTTKIEVSSREDSSETQGGIHAKAIFKLVEFILSLITSVMLYMNHNLLAFRVLEFIYCYCCQAA